MLSIMSLFAFCSLPFALVSTSALSEKFSDPVLHFRKVIAEYKQWPTDKKSVSKRQFQELQRIAIATENVLERIQVDVQVEERTKRARCQAMRKRFEEVVFDARRFFALFNTGPLQNSSSCFWNLPSCDILFAVCLAAAKYAGYKESSQTICRRIYKCLASHNLFFERRPDHDAGDAFDSLMGFTVAGQFAMNVSSIATNIERHRSTVPYPGIEEFITTRFGTHHDRKRKAEEMEGLDKEDRRSWSEDKLPFGAERFLKKAISARTAGSRNTESISATFEHVFRSALTRSWVLGENCEGPLTAAFHSSVDALRRCSEGSVIDLEQTVARFYQECNEIVEKMKSSGVFPEMSSAEQTLSGFLTRLMNKFLILWKVTVSFSSFQNDVISSDSVDGKVEDEVEFLREDSFTSALRDLLFLESEGEKIESSAELQNATTGPTGSRRMDPRVHFLTKLMTHPKWSTKPPTSCVVRACQYVTITRKVCSVCRKACHVECGYASLNNLSIPDGESPLEYTACSKLCWETLMATYQDGQNDKDDSYV